MVVSWSPFARVLGRQWVQCGLPESCSGLGFPKQGLGRSNGNLVAASTWPVRRPCACWPRLISSVFLKLPVPCFTSQISGVPKMQASASWQEAFLVEAFGTLRRFETNEAQVPAEVQSSHLVIPHEHTAHALGVACWYPALMVIVSCVRASTKGRPRQEGHVLEFGLRQGLH